MENGGIATTAPMRGRQAERGVPRHIWVTAEGWRVALSSEDAWVYALSRGTAPSAAMLIHAP